MIGEDELIARIAARLLPAPEQGAGIALPPPDWVPDIPHPRPPVPAAVLIALVRRPQGTALLFTKRSSSLRAHSGQVAFPGGKIDPTDADAAHAALREAGEEVGLAPADARILGFMPRYLSGTNYLITPVVAEVRPRGPFVANPSEVEAVFEVPLPYVLASENYVPQRLGQAGAARTSWRLLHESRTIWGITANLTRRFRDLASSAEAA
ncbi:NUDIX domain-containing protein [Devosia enhydra]|uniref:NUDIX domain-containing protein n=1 Tax=Devosia enhydra TaxID=665118 RepID=A0A1K2HW77_9HYPH|nr:CoA pyrophosphatase [Devosia enhydra]SFZ83132.1 NUDIX domain-containing protein [Devosia enhydra]